MNKKIDNSPSQQQLRLQLLENKAKQFNCLLASGEFSPPDQARMNRKKARLDARIESLKMDINKHHDKSSQTNSSCEAASRIQRAMRRHRFIKLKSRTHDLDMKLAQSDISEERRLLLIAKRMILVERIKTLAGQRSPMDGKRAMLQAKAHKVSLLLADPNITDAKRTQLSSRHLEISVRLNNLNKKSTNEFGCGGFGLRRLFGRHHHGKGGKGKGMRPFGCADEEQHHHSKGKGGKGKGMRPFGCADEEHHHGKGKGGKGKGMRPFGCADEEHHHGKGKGGKGKGMRPFGCADEYHKHGKGYHHGKGGKGKGMRPFVCAGGKGCGHDGHDENFDKYFDEKEMFDDYEVVTAEAEPYPFEAPNVHTDINEQDVSDLDLAFAIAMSMTPESDEEASDEDEA